MLWKGARKMRLATENHRTARMALLAGGLVFGMVATFSWVSGAYGTSMGPSQFDRYIALGGRLGSEGLNSDLNAQHPAGTSLVSLLARLERAGFSCVPDTQSFQGYDCHWRRAVSERRIAVIDTHVRSSGVRVVSVASNLGVYQR